MIYSDIQEQFNKVISYSQGIPNPNTDELFAKWLEAKRDFIEVFGGKLIVEIPLKVSFALDGEEKKVRLNDFIDIVYNTYSNEALGSFLEQESDGFFDNIVVRQYESSKGTIPKGMKLVKAFKYFESDKKTLENIQDCASRVIQENKIEGTLCFSVHPLDYLSSSENTYNWRSCHALDGEYRSGNLSYMVDKSTVICYLKGADNVNIPLFPQDVLWNSKKWRMLLYFSEKWDMVFAGRQYPFTSTPGLNLLFEHMVSIFYKNLDLYSGVSKWCNKYVDNESYPIDYIYVPVRGELLRMDLMVKDGDGALQFNDLLRSSCYTSPYYCIKDNYSWQRWNNLPPRFTIGNSVKCLCCGDYPITNSETMMCDNCELEYGHEENDVYGSCDCCGRRIILDDSIEVEDNLICHDCFHSQCFICSRCDEVHYNSNKIYNKETDSFVCCFCSEVSSDFNCFVFFCCFSSYDSVL